MKLRIGLFCMAFVLSTFTTKAAEPAAKPSLELRVKSIEDLAESLGYVVKISGQEDTGKQIEGIVKAFAAEAKGFEGINLTKPIGGYVTISENVGDSPIVLMLPIADSESFVALLKDKASLELKQDGDVYTTNVPNIPFPVHFRIANDYAYFTIREAKSIDKAKLISPKDFFTGKQASAASLVMYVERIPADLRKAAYGQIELQLKEMAKQDVGEPAEKLFRAYLVDLAAEIGKVLFSDAKSIAINFDIKPKADDITLDLTVTPKDGTTLAKNLMLWSDRPSKVAAIAGEKNPIASLGLNFALPPESGEKLTKLYTSLAELSIENKAGDELDIIKEVFESFLPTVKKGDLQLGVAVQDAGEKAAIVAGLGAKDGNKVEMIAKKLAQFVPEEAAKLSFSIESANGLNLHNVQVQEKIDGSQHFGNDLWLGTSNDLLAFGWSKTTKGLKAMAKDNTAKVPMLQMEVSFARFGKLADAAQAEKQKELNKEIFGEKLVPGTDTVRLVGTAGKELKLSLTLKGKAFAFAAKAGK